MLSWADARVWKWSGPRDREVVRRHLQHLRSELQKGRAVLMELREGHWRMGERLTLCVWTTGANMVSEAHLCPIFGKSYFHGSKIALNTTLVHSF